MSTIKIKRGTGSTAPATLVDGELAHAQGSNNLYIGSAATVVKVIDTAEVAATKALAETNETAIAGLGTSGTGNSTDIATNTAAIAVLNGATAASALKQSDLIDEDNLVSDDDTKVPSQQSVKAYVDTEVAAAIAGGMSYEGNFNSATVGTGGLKGQVYEVAAVETFLGEALEVGDTVTVKVDNPGTSAANYNFVNKNIDSSAFLAASEKAAASGVASLNADSEVVQLPAGAAAATAGAVLKQDGTWAVTAGTPDATETTKGIIEIATDAEAIAAASAILAVTPTALDAVLAAYTMDGGTF